MLWQWQLGFDSDRDGSRGKDGYMPGMLSGIQGPYRTTTYSRRDSAAA